MRELQQLAADVAVTVRTFMNAIDDLAEATTGRIAPRLEAVASAQATFANAAAVLSMRLADDEVQSYIEDMIKKSFRLMELSSQYVDNVMSDPEGEADVADDMVRKIQRVRLPMSNASDRFIESCRERLALPAQRELRAKAARANDGRGAAN